MRIKAAVTVLAGMLAAITLTSCTFIPNDISELESPPKLTTEQQGISHALEQYVGRGLTLKYPLEGKYRGAFVLRDINHDGSQEALAFYSNGSTGPKIAILSKIHGKWKIVQSLGNEATEIDSVQFGDFNGDGREDIAVGWRSLNLTLSVYLSEGSKYKEVKLCSFTKMLTMDMDGNGSMDILTLNIGDTKQAKANLISYRNGKLSVVSSSPLDSTVTGFAGVYVTKIKASEKQNVVLIDAYTSKNKIVTEVVYYKDGQLYSPLYNINSKTVNSTIRDNSGFKCTDINNDGVIDIPMLQALPTVLDKKRTNQNWLVNWSSFTGTGTLSQIKIQTLMNYTENYYFKYPAKWRGKVTVSRHLNDSVWDFCIWDSAKKSYGKVLFTIMAFNETGLDSISPKIEYHILAKSKTTVYIVQIPNNMAKDKLALSLSQIKNDFSLLS